MPLRKIDNFHRVNTCLSSIYMNHAKTEKNRWVYKFMVLCVKSIQNRVY